MHTHVNKVELYSKTDFQFNSYVQTETKYKITRKQNHTAHCIEFLTAEI